MVKKMVEDIIREASQLLQEDRGNTISQRDIVNQLAWLLFLKCLETEEIDKQCTDTSSPDNIESLTYHWNQWVPAVLNNKPEEATRRFLYNELHPYIEKIFQLKHEYMQVNTNFKLFIRLLHLLHDTEIIAMGEEDKNSILYSALFQLLTQENKTKGVFATPSPIVCFMVKVLGPQANDIVYDPACGTADLLAAAYRHVCGKGSAPATINFHGRDSAEQIIQLARMNMILHGLPPKAIQQQDVLQSPTYNSKVPEVSVVLTHPPLGSYSSPADSPATQKSLDCYETWFLQHSLQKLTKTSYARCGMVISNAFLDKKPNGVQRVKVKNTIQFRKEFLQKWNILMVVWLPAKTFGSLSNKQTYLLFCDNRMPTGKVLHYNLASYRNHKPYTEERPIRCEDFDDALTAWKQWKSHLENPENSPEPSQTDHQCIITYEPASFNRRDPDNLYSILMPSFDQEPEDTPKSSQELIEELQADCLALQTSCLNLQESMQRLQGILSDYEEKDVYNE